MKLRFPRFSAALLLLTMAACAPLPPAGPVPERPEHEAIRAFALEGRFSIKAGNEGQSGRIAWSHWPEGDNVLFLSPLGQGMATLEADATGARLELADRRSYSAATPDELTDKVLGRPLPLRRVPRWVLGLPGPGGNQTRDGNGQPLSIQEEGWRVDYLAWESDAPRALPTLLRISRDDVELKLHIDGWSLKP
ncbi:MAG: lipoprotein insertase outer membrane protein LolB [Rhodocyclaceae bacterium]|nr:lipoprotein insertase outer membrane protein LolB [Rhodocyclaceae bacterium]